MDIWAMYRGVAQYMKVEELKIKGRRHIKLKCAHCHRKPTTAMCMMPFS
jgi:hypothetical protein